MKIVQTFAKYDEGSPYTLHNKSPEKIYLNFYSFLLSYITLKQHYGAVTMFCNEEAYEAFIKYIPYDEIIIKENKNDFIMWAKYKLDCIRTLNENFIHVDSDVFVFNDLFQPFLQDDCDILVQNILPRKMNFIRDFVYKQKKFLKDNGIFTKPFDGKCFSCGTMGLKKKVHEPFFNSVDLLYQGMEDVGVHHFNCATMVLEEQVLYLTAKEHNFNACGIIPEDGIETNDDVMLGGDKLGYVHLWFGYKFKKYYIQQIRKKLFYEYPDYLDYVIKYEKEVMVNNKLFKYVVLPER